MEEQNKSYKSDEDNTEPKLIVSKIDAYNSITGDHLFTSTDVINSKSTFILEKLNDDKL